jgi:hypothetical protein
MKADGALRDLLDYIASLWREWKLLLTGGSIAALVTIWADTSGVAMPPNLGWTVVAATLLTAGFTSWRHERRNMRAIEGTVRALQSAQPDLGPESYRLSGYERTVLRILIESGGSLTGHQLYDRLLEWGIPVANRAESDLLMETFEGIAKKTPILQKEPFSDVWTIRKQGQP